MFYGHGAGDRHLKKAEVARFVREVSTGLRDVLAAQTSPMVLVGLTHLVAAYREVNSYGYLIEDAVDHNPDQLSTEQLHQMAWPLVEQRLRDERAQVIERFRGLHGTGTVCTDLPTVTEAARQGRVETLFVQADPWCWEQGAGDSPVTVQLGAAGQYAECEQVDDAAVATLNSGGQIYATSQLVVPDSQVAAILRY